MKNMAAKKVLEVSRGKQAHNKCKTEKGRCKSNSVGQTKFSNCEDGGGGGRGGGEGVSRKKNCGLIPMTFTEKCSSPFPQFEEKPLESLNNKKDEGRAYFGD